MKRFFAVLVSCAILISVFSLSVSAGNTKEIDEQILNMGKTAVGGYNDVFHLRVVKEGLKSARVSPEDHNIMLLGASLKHLYLWDAECCPVTEEIEKDENGKVTQKTERTFDEKGNLLTEIVYKDKSGTLTPCRKDVIEYGADGKPTVGYVYDYKSNAWQVNSITRFSFSGNTKTAIISSVLGTTETMREKTVTTIDASGNTVTEEYVYTDGAWQLVYKSTTEKNGDLATNISFDYEEGNIVSGTKFVYKETADGEEFPLWETYNYDLTNEIFVLETTEISEYDENGNRKSVKTYDGTGSLIESVEYETTLDKNGNEILSIYYDVLSGKVPVYKYETDYDENGNIIAERVYDFVADTSTWNKTSEFLSEYDKSGEKIKTTFTMIFDKKYVTETGFTYKHLHLGLEKINGKAPTDKSDGYKDYYYCKSCNRYYGDAECQNIIYDIEKWKSGEGRIPYTSPKTSDDTNYALIFSIMGVSLLAVFAVKNKVKQ